MQPMLKRRIRDLIEKVKTLDLSMILHLMILMVEI
jgi:hypothetical protein